MTERFHLFYSFCYSRSLCVHHWNSALSRHKADGTLLFVCRGSLALSPKFDYKKGIAQLVERPTEKSGAILTRVRVPGAARDFSPRVSFQCRLFYGVRTDSVCNRMHQQLCAAIPFYIFNFFIYLTHENTAHTDRNG